MAEQQNSLALPIILLGVNLFAFPNPESSAFTDTLFHLLNKLRTSFNAYSCDIYTENNVDSDYPFSVSIYRANIYGEAVAFKNGEVTYPLLENRVLDFLNEAIHEITNQISQNILPSIDELQLNELNISTQTANRILMAQRNADSLSIAIDQEERYYNKEVFYVGLENGLELYCMDYTGEVKLRFDELEPVHIIKDSLTMLYDLRISTYTLVDYLPDFKLEDKSAAEIQNAIDNINGIDTPELFALYERYVQKIKQLSKYLKTPEAFVRIAIKDGIQLHHTLQM